MAVGSGSFVNGVTTVADRAPEGASGENRPQAASTSTASSRIGTANSGRSRSFFATLPAKSVLIPGCLIGIVVAAFLLRFLTLREIPYPPSSDAAGDLIWLQVYLGHAPPGYTIQQAAPPIYILLVVLPFTTVLGTFLGIQALMATMPALLAFPTYLLMRWSRLGAVPSLVAAALMAFSPVTSNMVTWNSGFNVTGMLFLILFFALWIRTRDHSTLTSLAVAGFALSLVVGTHPLSAVYGVATIAVYLGISLASRGGTLLSQVRPTLMILGFTTLFSLPYVPIYVYTYTGLANVGIGSSSVGLATLWTSLSLLLGAAWGSTTQVPSATWSGLFILAEMLAAGFGLAFIWLDKRDWPLGTLCVSQILAALLIVLLDAANLSRALYFLPIAIIPLTVGWMTRTSQSGRLREMVARMAPRVRPMTVQRLQTVVRPVVVAAIALVVVTATAYISQTQMRSSESFYSILDSHSVAALNWLKGDTPSNATVFDGAGLQSWIPGYANRLSYVPGALTTQITSISYSRTRDANLIQLGTGVLGDGYLYVSSNFPGLDSSPGLYLRTQVNWDLLWSADASRTFVSVTGPGGPSTVSLASAASSNTSGQVYPNGTASMSSDFWYPGLGVTVQETVLLNGTTVELGFSAENGTVTSVSTYWSLPPSGYDFTYGSISLHSFDGSILQAIVLSNSRSIDLGFSGPSLNGTIFTDNSGWTRLSLSFPHEVRLAVDHANEVGPNHGTFYEDTTRLSEMLGISYYLVSSTSNYVVYLRLVAVTHTSPGSWTEPFQSGNLFIFQNGRSS